MWVVGTDWGSLEPQPAAELSLQPPVIFLRMPVVLVLLVLAIGLGWTFVTLILKAKGGSQELSLLLSDALQLYKGDYASVILTQEEDC